MRHLLALALWLCGAGVAAAASFPVTAVIGAQRPGPSAALFAAPYYTCRINYYVSNAGSDSNTGTSGSPWLTLAHANASVPNGSGGICVNVAPGTYHGVQLTHGGNFASSTGYVVYRCATMDACVVTDNGGINNGSAFETTLTLYGSPPNYIMIDGFTLSGSGNRVSNGIGVLVGNGNNGSGIASHHIWILNSILHDLGQAGVAVAAAEYFYMIHNSSYANASLSCSAQGSGLAINIPHTLRGYMPTTDDKSNPNPLIGPSWQVGSSFFHNVIEWNVTANNGLTNCGTPANPTDTDGNGIIVDTFLASNGNSEDYPSPTLIAFNVSYNNGGVGIHSFFSAYIYVANNSCYNNHLDPAINGGGPCIDNNQGYSDVFLNNIATANPADPGGACAFGSVPYAQFNNAINGGALAPGAADIFSGNITQLRGRNSCWGSFGKDAPTGENAMFNLDTYSCSLNKCATDPVWTDVGHESVGTETTQPIGVNFALMPTSPAIGYGAAETYLSVQSLDAGACFHTLLTCP